MNDKKWQLIWSRKYAPYIGSSYFKVFTTRKNFNQLQNKLFVPEGKLMAVYAAEDEWQELLRKATNMLLKTDIKKFAVDYENKFKKFLAWGKKTARLPYREYNNQRLIKLLENCTRELESSGETQFFSFVVLEGPGKEVEKAFAGQSDILSWISTPHKETKLMKIRLELLQMAKSGRVNQIDLEKYAKKYAWTTMYDFVDAPLSISEIKEQLKSIQDPGAEINNYNKLRRQNLSAYKKFIKMVKDGKLKKLIEIIHYFSYLKEMRDDYRRQVYYSLKPIFQEMAKRVGWSFVEFNYLLHEEMAELLRGKNKNYQIQARERMRNYSLVLKNGKLKIFNFDVGLKYLTGNDSDAKIYGMVASRGFAKGRARIIFHRDDFDKFNAGEILVTPMTHPEFLPIMKKATAIVTDEGGLTCHAAIVAREMKKPCIIGTKIATKVFKNGDLVEVDAERGVVRKV